MRSPRRYTPRPSAMTLEVELKYHADGPGPLEHLAAASGLGAATLGEARTVDEVDRYLDTTDGRLSAARWACRLRSRDGSIRISLKGPPEPGSGGGLHRRPEVEGPAGEGLDPTGWPAGDARDLLERLRGGRPLVERFRLLQRRTERPVAFDGGNLGTLTLDVVQVVLDDRRLGTLHAVELEVVGEDATASAHLAELDAALAAVDGLERDDRTKLEHALSLLPDR